MEKRIFLTAEEAINLLPEGNKIHTTFNPGVGVLLGADWDREDLIKKIRDSEYREVTGQNARSMKHGLALFNGGPIYQGDILFVETDMSKLDSLYPEEDEQDE